MNYAKACVSDENTEEPETEGEESSVRVPRYETDYSGGYSHAEKAEGESYDLLVHNEEDTEHEAEEQPTRTTPTGILDPLAGISEVSAEVGYEARSAAS